MFAPDGRCVARYDKIHLFWFDNGREQFHEGRVIEAGDNAPVQFDLPRATATAGAWACRCATTFVFLSCSAPMPARVRMLLVPSAFTHVTGQAHWEVLLRARAIENLAYVVAPAQGGVHENGRHLGPVPGG